MQNGISASHHIRQPVSESWRDTVDRLAKVFLMLRLVAATSPDPSVERTPAKALRMLAAMLMSIVR